MKPASSAKRAKRAKAAAKSAKQPRSKKKSTGKSSPMVKSGLANFQAGRTNKSPNEGLIAHARPTTGRQELQAAAQLLKVGAIGPGLEVEELEKEFCQFLGLPEGHALAVVNGTTALYLALYALDASGKSVAMPVYANASLRSAARLAGASEKLLDISENGIHIDLNAATTCGAEIVIVPHTFGLPVNISALKGKKVIEDCGDALGAKVGEIYTGLQGDIGVYSFAASNIITCGGQGGMLVSRDRALIDKARNYRQFNGEHDGQPHFNFTLTDMQAAIGRVQLTKLPNFLARREEIFAEYLAAGFDLIDSHDKDNTPVRYRAVIRSDRAEAVAGYLNRGMIESIVPVPSKALLGDGADFPHAAKLSASTISIPIYPHLSNAEVQEIIEQVQLALVPS